MYAADTIVAIATPPGHGGIGVLRISGPAAAAIGEKLFRRRRPGRWQPRRLHSGTLTDGSERAIDDGLAVLMPAPHSYTGEDVLELQCHGSPAVLQAALAAVLRAGARAAERGEFTKRAFLNGKLDLTQAEAVADLVNARTRESADQARDQLGGHLSRHLQALRDRLLRIKGHLEVQIDFADEDTGFDAPVVVHEVEESISGIDALIRTYARGRLLREGMRIAITGRPNVGKSSLLNALLGEDRAIVTAIPGTTRDVIEESADFDGVPVVLIDTAGLRDTGDEVERIGVSRARAVAANADVVLVVLDGAQPPVAPESLDAPHAIMVLNKSDLPLAWPAAALDDLSRRGPVVGSSAKTGAGLDALRRAVLETVATVASDGVPPLTSARQRDALVKANQSLTHAREGLRRNLAPELIAVDLQGALDDIGAVTGIVTSDEVLDVIFREFCLGK